MSDEIEIVTADEDGCPKHIRFTPPGHVHPLNFQRGTSTGNSGWSVGVSGYDRAGGVMTLEQMTALRDMLNVAIAEWKPVNWDEEN